MFTVFTLLLVGCGNRQDSSKVKELKPTDVYTGFDYGDSEFKIHIEYFTEKTPKDLKKATDRFVLSNPQLQLIRIGEDFDVTPEKIGERHGSFVTFLLKEK